MFLIQVRRIDLPGVSTVSKRHVLVTRGHHAQTSHLGALLLIRLALLFGLLVPGLADAGVSQRIIAPWVRVQVLVVVGALEVPGQQRALWQGPALLWVVQALWSNDLAQHEG